MKAVVAIDSLKGSLSSVEAGNAIAATLPVSIFLFHKSMRNIRFKKGEKNEGSSCD